MIATENGVNESLALWNYTRKILHDANEALYEAQRAEQSAYIAHQEAIRRNIEEAEASDADRFE